MKQLSILVALIVCTITTSYSQVKKQYKDKTFNQTTVLVKEDKASDADILNGMDLDDIGMDQIIQIKTAPVENELKKEEPQTLAENTTVQQRQQKQNSADLPEAKPAKKEFVPYHSGDYEVVKSYPMKKNRRFRPSKRKKVKKSKNKMCFRF